MSKSEIAASEWMGVTAAIDACRQQLRSCERTIAHYQDDDGDYHDGEQYESEKGYLGSLLQQANLRMLLLIERAGLPLFRSTYVEAMRPFDGKFDVVEHSPHDPEDLYSDPLILLDQTFEALSAIVRGARDRELSALALFESILRQAPYILTDREIVPTSEAEVRRPLFDVLKAVFPDCQREIPVPHIFKLYRADLGVRSIKALAEIKYAIDEKELRTQIGGIYEDMKGYAGDPQWSQFFAVFYTATPVAAPERIEEEFRLSRVDYGWVPIIVHGTGTRRLPAPRVANKSTTRPAQKRLPIKKASGRSVRPTNT